MAKKDRIAATQQKRVGEAIREFVEQYERLCRKYGCFVSMDINETNVIYTTDEMGGSFERQIQEIKSGRA